MRTHIDHRPGEGPRRRIVCCFKVRVALADSMLLKEKPEPQGTDWSLAALAHWQTGPQGEHPDGLYC